MNRTLLAAFVLVISGLVANSAAAQPGSADNPIVVRMKPGTDEVRLTGILSQNSKCCAYLIEAHAGQTLEWSIAGPVTRETITYPDGNTDGPGLRNSIPLPADGAYVFSVSPDLMAEGAFGHFVLMLKIPPKP